MARKSARYSADRVSSDFLLDIAAGRVAGWSHVNKFGLNSDVDTSPAAEDIWETGGDYTGFITTASQVEIFSSSSDDTALGTGANTVSISGLDADFDEQEETIALNGAGTVVTTASFIRVSRCRVLSAGSSEANIGIITLQDSQPVTLATISIGDNQTLMAVYTVPTNKRGLIFNLWSGINSGSGAGVETDIALVVRPFGETFQLKFRSALTKGGVSHFVHPFQPPIIAESKSDIKMRSLLNDSLNTKIAAGFDIILVDI